MEVPDPVLAIARSVSAAGGRLFVVGGAVRDGLLGHPAKDLDLEVHGLDEGALEPVLARYGTARRVGRSFPVFKLRHPVLGELDVALPRSVIAGADPVAEAARHRDLTINAMLHDPLRGLTLDPWGGQADLAAGRLRAVDESTFVLDPVRALRVAVLAGRLGFKPDPDLVVLCRSLDLSECPPERVGLELQKLWLRAPRPAVGLSWIAGLGLGEEILPGVELNAPTLAAVDRAAAWREQLEEPGDGPVSALAWSVLLRHHPAPVAVLDRAGTQRIARWPVRDRVLDVLDAAPGVPGDDAGLRRLAERHPIWLVLRTHAAWAAGGDALERLARAALLGVARSPLPPLLRGRDLLALGVQPGPQLGQLLEALRGAQLDGLVSDETGAQTWVRRRIGCAVDADTAQDEPTP